MCRDARRDLIETRSYARYESKNLGAQFWLGVLLGSAGGVALGVADQVDDTDPDGDGSELSPRAHVYIWGSVGAAVGALFLGHSLYIAAKSVDVHDPWIRSSQSAVTGVGVVCERVQVPSGTVFTMLGSERVKIASTSSASFAVRPRKLADVLCSDPEGAVHGSQLEIFWQASAGGDSVSLGTFDRAVCTASFLALTDFARAEVRVRAAVGAEEVALGLRELDSGRDWLRRLPVDDAEYAALDERAVKLQTMFAAKTAAIAENEVQRAVRLLASTDLSTGLKAAERALAVVNAGGAERRTQWQRVYRAAITKIRASEEDLRANVVRLLEIDPEASRCLVNGMCADWMDEEFFADALNPVLADAARVVRLQSGALDTGSALLDKKVSASAIVKIDEALLNLKVVELWCEDPRLAIDPLNHACEELLTATSRTRAMLETKAVEIARHRSEMERKEKARVATLFARKWRVYFSDCRRVLEAARRINEAEWRGQCGRECEAVAMKVRNEVERLAEFSVDESVDDPKLVRALQQECETAGCGNCP